MDWLGWLDLDELLWEGLTSAEPWESRWAVLAALGRPQ